jgi:uncharacterized protein YbcI
MSTGQQAQQYDGAGQSDLARISTEMVRLYKEQFGRGPTGARSFWCGDDVISCVLEDTLTPAERSLVRMGEHERLRETRMYFQYASVEEFCEPIERITGRVVRSFISGTDTQVEGLSMETFILHPDDGGEHMSRREFAGV